MKKVLIIICLFHICIAFNTLHAQTTFSTSGNDISGKGGSLCYSVGLVVYNCADGSSGTLDDGIQIPFEIFFITGIPEHSLSINAYPNPVTTYITLEVMSFKNENLYYLIYGINGKVYESNRIVDLKTKINMENLPPSTYFLRVISNQKEITLFKIIKN